MNLKRKRSWRPVPLRLGGLMVVLVAFSAGLSGCAFTYIPLLRDVQAPEPQFTVSERSELLQTDDRLTLKLEIQTVPEADWLAVQWFNPANEEVYASSLWIRPTPAAQPLSRTLPPRIALESGLWRAVISYKGDLIRQFSTSVRVR